MPCFDVNTCRSTSRPDLRCGETALRTLELEGRSHGEAAAPVRCVLVFSAALDGPAPAAAVGYATEAAMGLSIVGWLPASAFDAYREVLAGTVDCQVHYELRDSRATGGYLRRLGLGTSCGESHTAPARTSRRPATPARATAFAMPL